MNIVAVLANYTLVSLGSPGTRLAGDNPRSEVVNSEQQDLCLPQASSLISPGWPACPLRPEFYLFNEHKKVSELKDDWTSWV